MYKIVNRETNEWAECHTIQQAAELVAEWERERGRDCYALRGGRNVKYTGLFTNESCSTITDVMDVSNYRISELTDLTKSTLFPQLETA